MPQARQNWIPWLLLGALCMGARTVASAQSDSTDSPPPHLVPPPQRIVPPPQRIVEIQSPQTGSLAGRLTNLHSAPLAGVSVVLRNQATGAEAHTTTAKNGAFRFASLDAGNYTLDADAAQLGHGRLEEILVTGGIESRVQAAMNFEPVPPTLLQAAAPPQIAGPPAVSASTASTEPTSTEPMSRVPALSITLSSPPPSFTAPVAPPLAPSLASTPSTVAPNNPLALPRPALVAPSPQLIASIPDQPLSRLLLPWFAAPDAARPSTQPSSPTPTPSQSLTEPAPPTRVSTPTAKSSNAPTQAPSKSTIVPSLLATTAPSTPQRAQPENHLPVLPERAALETQLETQSVTLQLALAAAPQRPFPLNTSSAPILAAAVPASLLPAALLSLPPVAAAVAAAQPPDPVTPAVSTTMNASQLQALPASGRRWQEFLLDTPAASPSAGSSQASFRGSQESAEVTVDGANTRLAFGVAAGSATRGASGDDSQNSTSQSGNRSQSGGSWSGGRGLGVSEAAIREVTTAAGNVEAEGMRSAGGRTTIRTESGGNAFHGQGFLFDRQNTWGAQNPFTQWVTQTSEFAPLAPFNTTLFPVFDNFQYSSGQSGSPESYTPPDHEIVWGVGAGSRIRRDKLFWFAALDSNHRNDPGLAMVKHPYLQPPCETSPCAPTGFFATPSAARLQLLSAQLDLSSANPAVEGLTAYSQMLETLAGLLGPAPRTSAHWVGFARIDWQAAERHHFTLEGTGADLNAPGGGLSRVSETYGSHSFGSSQTSHQWLLARWEAYLTPNLLTVTQGSAGRAIHSAKPDAPSAFEKTFLTANAYGQLPQIVVDSRYGFTIGNPARFGQGSYPDERLFDGQEMLDWVHNRLLVKAGFELDHNADAISLLRNQTGTYTYSKVENFISDALAFQKFGPNPSGWNASTNHFDQHNCDPTGKVWQASNGQLMGLGALPCYSHYSQMIGPTNWNLSTNDWAGYVTAQWQTGKLAVFSAGLRWEREQMPPPLAALANSGLPQAGEMPDLGNNWGPRISFAIGNAKSRWPVIRLGYGMYYGRVANATIETALTQTGSFNGDLSFFMRPTDGYTSIDGTSNAPFFPYVLQGQPASVIKPSVVEFAPNFRNPEVHQAIASIEEPLPGHIELTAEAMLSLGRRLPVSIDANLAPTTQTITYTVCDQAPSGAGNGACGNLGLGPIKAARITVPFYASSVNTGVAGWLNSNYQEVDQFTSKANSTYEAATVKITRDSSRGLSLHAHYTYAHAMDWNPNESPLDANPADLGLKYGLGPRPEYGTSNQDVRHSAAVMLIYEAPWKLHSFAGHIANGWMLSGIGQFRSGLPYTMHVTGSLPKETQNSPGSSGYPIVGLRPGMNGSGGDNRVYGLGNGGQVYNIGRNTFRYPNTWKADLRIAKHFDIGERRQLEVLAESFNLFNHQNVTGIETTGYYIESGSSTSPPTLNFLTGLKTNSTTGLPTPAFGHPLDINATDFYRERQIEIGLRMRF